jgi:hypothetical protein
MKETIISFETAKLAKEKGFKCDDDYYFNLYAKKLHRYKSEDWGCAKEMNSFILYQGEFNNHIIFPAPCFEPYYFAPSQGFLQKWLREKHNIHIEVLYIDQILNFKAEVCIMTTNTIHSDTKCGTYEEVLEIGLLQALKLIK